MGAREQQQFSMEEGVAIGHLREVGPPDPPMDAFVLAELFGVEVRFGPGSRARLVGSTIHLPAKATPMQQQDQATHELGHWALRDADEPDTEESAWLVGAAFMLPRDPVLADIERSEWDLRSLRARHLNCSAEMIARRIVELADGVCAIWDHGKLRRRVWSPWLAEGYQRVSRFESELAARVLSSGETTREDDRLWGFPMFDGRDRRVITVCEAEQLAIRYRR